MTQDEFISTLLLNKKNNQLVLLQDFDKETLGRVICAFLNSEGGRIIIGLDENDNPVHNPDIGREISNLEGLINDNLSPSSLISIKDEQYKNGKVVLIEVIQGTQKPYSFKNRTFIRKECQTIPADANDMAMLIRSRRQDEYSWERSAVLEAGLEDLDNSEIQKSIEYFEKLNRYSRQEIKEAGMFLEKFNLYRNGALTNAAIVLFAKEPVYFSPQCRIRIIRYGTGKTSSRYKDTVIIESNLFTAIRTIQDYFKTNLPIVSLFSEQDWQRSDRRAYPLKALDEAVINALMHRDYSDLAGEVLISIYTDRIEIMNSGELPSFFKDQTLRKEHRSIPPNPDITHIVFLRGLIEKVGRGTVLICEEFEKLGLEPPHWESKHGATTLTLYSLPKKIIINERMRQYLDSIDQSTTFTRDDYQSFFSGNISERTARGDLLALTEGGWISKHGDGAATKYKRTVKPLPDIAG